MTAALPSLAALRIEVFRAWPYLYDGTLAYEQNYLQKFAASDGAVIVAAYDGDDIVGVATAAPMVHHAAEFAAPFQTRGYDITKIFYFGESVLKASLPWARNWTLFLRRTRATCAEFWILHARRVLRCGEACRSSDETGWLCAA